VALVPGTRLGPYEVIAQIGAGGMGEVYRARDTKLNRDIALIVIEVMLSRIVFMAASREGQLNDIRIILSLQEDGTDPSTFERLAATMMLLRRDDPSTLKVFDLERLAQALRKSSDK